MFVWSSAKVAIVAVVMATNSLIWRDLGTFSKRILNYPLSTLRNWKIWVATISTNRRNHQCINRGERPKQSAQGTRWQMGKSWLEADRVDGALNFFANKEDFALRNLTQMKEKKPLRKLPGILAKAERLPAYTVRWAYGDLRWSAWRHLFQVAMDETHPLEYGTGGKFMLWRITQQRCLIWRKEQMQEKSCQMNSYRTG